MQSSIFLRNITCLDHASINEDGVIHGMSFHISATVTGKVDSQESVVVDFSKCKKLLKSFIDDPEEGFDHKLLIYPFSKHQVTGRSESQIMITTPYFNTNCPINAVRFLTGEHELSSYLTRKMQEHYPELEITVKSKASQDGFTSFGTYFTYSHGLKDSSSWGCQNQNHGHLSFVEILRDGVKGDYFLQKEIAEYLDGAVILSRPNIVSETPEGIEIQYTTCDRGTFTSYYYKTLKIIVLDTETTIEYIIEHVKAKYLDRLKGATLRISEGLAKGAEVHVD